MHRKYVISFKALRQISLAFFVGPSVAASLETLAHR